MAGRAGARVYHPGMGGLKLADGWDPKDGFIFFDDFFKIDDTATVGDWNEQFGDNTPTYAVGDAAGGILTMTTNGSGDNDEAYLESMHELFLCQTDKQFSFEARLKLTEANTDDANWCIGLSDTTGDETLVDNGAGLATSFDGMLFYKVDGTMSIYFRTSNATTQSTAVALDTFTSARWFRVGFDYNYNDGVTAKVTPWVYDETDKTMITGVAHDLTISGLEEMHILFGLKNGDTNNEAMLIDYVGVWHER